MRDRVAHRNWLGLPPKMYLLMANTVEHTIIKALTFQTQAYVEELDPLRPRPVEK